MRDRQVFLTLAFPILLMGFLFIGCAHPAKVDSSATPASSIDIRETDKSQTRLTRGNETLWQRWKKKLPWNWKKEEPISEETTDLVCKYIRENDLGDIHIEYRNRVAKEEWQRLKQNHRINPLVRYTVGGLNWVASSIHPPFIPGRNHYDSFSDTMYIYTDEPAPILAELALAKSLRKSRFPGGEAIASKLPVLSIYSRVNVAMEVNQFARKQDDWSLEKETYRELYPSMFSGAGVVTAAFVPFYAMPLINLGGMAVGMAMGEAAIQMREGEIRQAHLKEQSLAFPDSKSITAQSISSGGELAKKP